MASGSSPEGLRRELRLLTSKFLAEHARVNLPGFVAPLLVDESAGCTFWDSGTSRSSGEPVELRTNGEIEAAGCWEEGRSGEERYDCTPASPFASVPPFASEAAPAATATAGSAAMSLQRRSAVMGRRHRKTCNSCDCTLALQSVLYFFKFRGPESTH